MEPNHFITINTVSQITIDDIERYFVERDDRRRRPRRVLDGSARPLTRRHGPSARLALSA
jgi:hypothetical protein